MNVIIFGATGVAGSGVLEECLKHPGINKITVVVRRSTGISDDKLREVIHHDYKDFSNIKSSLQDHDACFYCLGVSQTRVRNEADYNEITFEYTVAAARAVYQIEKNLIFCFLSAAGADTSMESPLMWTRIKGKAENGLKDFPFLKLYIFRPGIIRAQGGVKSRIWAYRMFDIVYPVINLLFPSWVITNLELGRAMINAAMGLSIENTLSNRDIRILAGIDSGLGVLS